LLGSLKEGPERTEHEIELQRILCNTLAVTKGFESKEAGAAFRRTAELSRETGNSRALMAALLGIRIYHFGRNELHRGCEVAQQHLAEARRVGDKFNEAAALAGLGELLTYQGEFVLRAKISEPRLRFASRWSSPWEEERPTGSRTYANTALTSLRSRCGS